MQEKPIDDGDDYKHNHKPKFDEENVERTVSIPFWMPVDTMPRPLREIFVCKPLA